MEKNLSEEEWSHEELDIIDTLKAGNASLLVQHLLDGKTINKDLHLIVENYLIEGMFQWKSNTPKIGRPKSDKWDDWSCIGLFRAKKHLREARPNMRVIDIEGTLAREYGLNVDDLKANITKGKKLLSSLASKPDMKWAEELLMPPLKSKGKKK